MKLSNSQEEYLKTIYILNTQSEKVRVTDIAQKLKITKPSVNKAVNVLKELQLLCYEAYGDIQLTEEGIEVASEILRKQDILEIFIAGVLNVDETQAKTDASAIKCAMSNETEEKLHKYIIDIFNLQGLGCKCNYNEEKDSCKNCTNTKLREKINKNENWKKTIIEEKGVNKCC